MTNTLKKRKNVDAVVVAGEAAASFRVLNQHKAFLKFKNRPSILHVVDTLRQVDRIGDIYVVGPKESLTKVFEPAAVDRNAPKAIHLIQQKGNLYENVWQGFVHSLPGGAEMDVQRAKTVDSDKAVLVVPCDAPLIGVRELEFFIEGSDMDRYDYVLGLTPESSMEYFYPRKGLPGIKMSYLHMKEKNYRINNLHMVKPARVKNRDHINTMYAYRYQKRIINIVRLGLYVIRVDRLRSYKLLIGLQLALKCSEWNLTRLTRFFSGWAPRKGLEKAISKLLNTRFASLEVPYPGAALDIDNDGDYRSLTIMFDRWRKYLATLK